MVRVSVLRDIASLLRYDLAAKTKHLFEAGQSAATTKSFAASGQPVYANTGNDSVVRQLVGDLHKRCLSWKGRKAFGRSAAHHEARSLILQLLGKLFLERVFLHDLEKAQQLADCA